MLVVIEEEALAALIADAVSRALVGDREAPALVDVQGAADLLCLSKQSIEMLAKRGRIPSVVMPNRRRRFERDALLAWAKGRQS